MTGAIAQPGEPRTSYLDVGYTARSWLLATDHKRVAVLYLVALSAFCGAGGAAALLLRLGLVTPDGALAGAEVYDRLFTAHGILMVWFFAVPAIPAVLGGFLVPLMIGARNLAFPRLNLLSWYLYLLGGLFVLVALVTGGVDTGWTFTPPYSTTYAHSKVVAALVGVLIAAGAALLVGLNLLATIHTRRAPGLTWSRLPPFVWALYAASLLLVLATPVLIVALLLAIVARAGGGGLFAPALGGDPLLFADLFWFGAQSALYAILLAGIGVVSEIVACFARRPLAGYPAVAGSCLAIAALAGLGWGQHLVAADQTFYAGLVFSLFGLLLVVPLGVVCCCWLATLRRGTPVFGTPLVYALGCVVLLATGGACLLFLAALAPAVDLAGTTFDVAALHYLFAGSLLMAYLGGLHFWWPKLTGRLYPAGRGWVAALLVFAGVNLTALPQAVLGYLGMPARANLYPATFQGLHVVATMGSLVLALGVLLPASYLLRSLRRGDRAGANPWGATGLEWSTASPPPPENFAVPPAPSRWCAADRGRAADAGHADPAPGGGHDG